MRQQEETETEATDGQDGADGPPHGTDTLPGSHTGPQTALVPRLERGVFLGVAHHPRQLALEVVHQLPLTPPAR